MKRWFLHTAKLVAIGVLVVYVAAYVSLSRSGRAEAIRNHRGSFYYFTPEDSDEWRAREHFYIRLFRPLNQIDRLFNPEMEHNSTPLHDLE